jgi:hypothetical protein
VEEPIRIDFQTAHEASLVVCARCGHERARHIDRDDLEEPCDEPECPCVRRAATMTNKEKLHLAERLARALLRLGLDEQVAELRRYYVAVRSHRPFPKDGWNDAQVIEVAKTHRVAPFENAYPVRPTMSTCGCSMPQKFTLGTFPGGSKHKCAKCQDVWLELE